MMKANSELVKMNAMFLMRAIYPNMSKAAAAELLADGVARMIAKHGEFVSDEDRQLKKEWESIAALEREKMEAEND